MNSMTIDYARSLVQRYFEDALNRADLSVVDRIIAPGFTLYVPPSARFLP